MRALLVDDEKNFADAVKEYLGQYMVMDVAYKGSDGEYLAHINEYDLIILDYVLPDTNGLELCLKLRRANIRVPILFVTVRYGIRDKVAALDAGADDYIVKPFSVKELHARIRALMRRSSNVYNDDIFFIDDVKLNVTKRSVTRSNKEITLRRKEFDLLEYMIRNQNYVLSRTTLAQNLWENPSSINSNTIDVHIKYLRDKIDKNSSVKLIKTVHGIGYKIVG